MIFGMNILRSRWNSTKISAYYLIDRMLESGMKIIKHLNYNKAINKAAKQNKILDEPSRLK
jgi:hypothetical protein